MNVLVKPNGPRSAVYQSPKPGTRTDEDGGLYVTPEQLARFADGDAKRGRRELRAFLAADRESAIYNGPTVKPVNVRLASEKDEPALLELLRIDIMENAETVAPMDDGRVLEVIQVGTRRRGGFVGVIDSPKGEPIAVTVLHPGQPWWSQGWWYNEIVNFVHPDFRGRHYLDDLINFGRWAVDQQTAGFGYRVYLICGVMGTRRLHAKTALYRRKFTQVGAAFCYPTPPGMRSK